MRKFLKGYLNIWGYGLKMAALLFVFTVGGTMSGLFVYSPDVLQMLNHFVDTNMRFIAIGTVLALTLAMVAAGNVKYLLSPGEEGRFQFFRGNFMLTCLLPVFLLGTTYFPLIYAPDTPGAEDAMEAYAVIGIVGIFGALMCSFILSMLVEQDVKQHWQVERIDALKEKTIGELREYGAVLQHDANKLLNGKSYAGVKEVSDLCLSLKTLAESQDQAYSKLQALLEGAGVDMSYGAAFSNKSAQELMDSEEKEPDG